MVMLLLVVHLLLAEARRAVNLAHLLIIVILLRVLLLRVLWSVSLSVLLMPVWFRLHLRVRSVLLVISVIVISWVLLPVLVLWRHILLLIMPVLLLLALGVLLVAIWLTSVSIHFHASSLATWSWLPPVVRWSSCSRSCTWISPLVLTSSGSWSSSGVGSCSSISHCVEGRHFQICIFLNLYQIIMKWISYESYYFILNFDLYMK